MNTVDITMIKVTIPCCGNDDVYYFKPKNKKVETYKYVDSLYYCTGDSEHRIGYTFREFLFNRFNGTYTKEQLDYTTVEFITDFEVEEIDF